MKIFITGVSSGLGVFLAKEFISSGDEVWGIGRRYISQETINKSFPGLFRYNQCDTTDIDQVKNTFEQMIVAEYIPDVIIFCAGMATEDIYKNNFRLHSFKENFNVNLFGMLYWIELFLPYFIKRSKGTFAAVSSMSIYRETRKDRIGYSASRIAMNKTFENLRLEYYDTKINFTIFNMGRMPENTSIVGISYSKAAYMIVKKLKTLRHNKIINIPLSQYLLTRIIQFVPDKIFKTYLMKK